MKMKNVNKLIDEGKDFVQKEDIAEQMNNHFCSLGSKLASCIPDTAVSYTHLTLPTNREV